MNKEAEAKVMAAVQKTFEGIYAPAFFQKLASYGVVPESQEAATEYLKLALDLRNRGVEPERQGSEEVDAIKTARAALNPNLSLHENAATADGLIQAFVNNAEIRKLAKENLSLQLEAAAGEK